MPTPKNGYSICALATIAAVSFSQTGCNANLTAERASQVIYQPRSLMLKAGQSVPTAEGVYTPQTDEIWHSRAAFDLAESRLRDAEWQLQQLRLEAARNR